MRIRRATTGDAAAVASVQVRSWQAAYRGLMPDEVLDGLSVDQRAHVWRPLVEAGEPGEGVLVAETDVGVVGFAHVCPARDADAEAGTGEVSAIYLLPEVWGTGHGRALMDAALRRLREDGYRSAILWVLVGNERARRFYAAAGWSCDGAEKTATVGGFATITETRYRRPLPTGA